MALPPSSKSEAFDRGAGHVQPLLGQLLLNHEHLRANLISNRDLRYLGKVLVYATTNSTGEVIQIGE